jgi:hypothetical protein
MGKKKTTDFYVIPCMMQNEGVSYPQLVPIYAAPHTSINRVPYRARKNILTRDNNLVTL